MTAEAVLPLLRRAAAQFAAAIAEGSVRHDTPGYRIHIWPTPHPFYRNVAIPIAAEASSPGAIATMLERFAAEQRTARLEFAAELWPALGPALERAGLVVERRAALMLRSAAPRLPPPARPASPLGATTPRPALAAFLASAESAFDEPTALTAPGEVELLARGLAAGTILAAACLVDDRPVAGASLTRAGPVAELAGVWCEPGWRRRGLARAACGDVLSRFFAAGGELAWLSAGDAAGMALYHRLGFVPGGSQLNHAAPAVILT